MLIVRRRIVKWANKILIDEDGSSTDISALTRIGTIIPATAGVVACSLVLIFITYPLLFLFMIVGGIVKATWEAVRCALGSYGTEFCQIQVDLRTAFDVTRGSYGNPRRNNC